MTPVESRSSREWTRVHPVSPLLGGWAVFAALLGVVAYNQAPDYLTGNDVDVDIDAIPYGPLILVVGGLLLVLIVIGVGYIQWHFQHYKIGDEAVHLHKGVIFRQQVQARLNRLQAVDTVQPLLARLFGFAKVRIEVAGGEGSALEIAFLRADVAEELRNEIVLLAAGHAAPVAQDSTALAQPGTAPAPDEGARLDHLLASPAATAVTAGIAAAPQRQMLQVPTGRLILSLILSVPFMVLASIPVVVIAIGVVVGDDVAETLGVILGTGFVALLPVALAFFGYFWSQVSSGFGFTAAISQDGIRLAHGLLEKRRQTVPPGRVQAVRVRQPILWRRKDWWRITINVAGYQDQQQAVSTLLPVGSRQDALTALWLVLPDLGDPDPAGTISRAMSGVREEGGFTGSPKRSMVFDLIQWRHRGVKATSTALLIRRGWLTRELFVVPHERTQSLAVTQGPLQRILRLANFVVHSTQGPVIPVAYHLDADDAAVWLDSQAGRARESRKRQTPEQWMVAVGLSE